MTVAELIVKNFFKKNSSPFSKYDKKLIERKTTEFIKIFFEKRFSQNVKFDADGLYYHLIEVELYDYPFDIVNEYFKQIVYELNHFHRIFVKRYDKEYCDKIKNVNINCENIFESVKTETITPTICFLLLLIKEIKIDKIPLHVKTKSFIKRLFRKA